MALPVYYRNKIYNENDRENLWLEKLDKNERFVDGIKIDVSKSQKEYINIRESARTKYLQLGFNGEFNWKEEQYENERRTLLQEQRGASGGSSPDRQVLVVDSAALRLPDEKKENKNDLSKYTDWKKWE